ncbi:pentraxin-related protein PTX3 [Centroberyx gerrardi]
MFRWSLPQAACVLSVCVSLALAYEDDIEVNYADTYYNEITEGEPQEPTPSPAPCKSPDLTKWDKLFSMLENSQMRENMLLQYADEIIKVEMGSLRGEMLRFVAQYGGSCCETALLFPMRSRRIYTSVIPDVPLSLSSFTVCLWAKPAAVSNKTVLFSYGTRRNPYEIQLLLGQTSALFTVGGEAHLVEARGVVNAGGAAQWIHLCGAWSSKQGLASLWADGKKVASTPGVAEGHVLPDGGSLQLGQERNGCCPGSPSAGGGTGSGVPGFEGGFDAKLAFPGKMTGVNMWDRVLSEEEISQLALRDGQGCEQRGNMVAWGVTEMVPHGGAQFID